MTRSGVDLISRKLFLLNSTGYSYNLTSSFTGGISHVIQKFSQIRTLIISKLGIKTIEKLSSMSYLSITVFIFVSVFIKVIQ